MAYFDHEAARRRKESIEKFDELKKFIISKDDNNNLNEWFPANFYIAEMEKTIEEQKQKIEEYQKFFSMMQKLMPKQHSIHDLLR